MKHFRLRAFLSFFSGVMLMCGMASLAIAAPQSGGILWVWTVIASMQVRGGGLRHALGVPRRSPWAQDGSRRTRSRR